MQIVVKGVRCREGGYRRRDEVWWELLSVTHREDEGTRLLRFRIFFAALLNYVTASEEHRQHRSDRAELLWSLPKTTVRINDSMAYAQLLLVVLVTLVTTSRAAFPWCSCVDYSPSSSPYFLSLISTVATADNVTAVFRVDALPVPPSPSICYQTLLNNGIEKIEIASQLACLRNARVLIDGLPSSASGVALPANFRTVANIKIKFPTLAVFERDDDSGFCGDGQANGRYRSRLTFTALAGQAFTVVVEGFPTDVFGPMVLQAQQMQMEVLEVRAQAAILQNRTVRLDNPKLLSRLADVMDRYHSCIAMPVPPISQYLTT
ncbi:hypothetical protein QJQ45_013054 [Haematococcus lacustris]|nr:hypothetical protein QJQ45_013054 [Haematococcus lacustris]